MRSLFSFGASREIARAANGTGKRPELLRREAIAETAAMMALVSALAMPFAIYVLTDALALPFIICSVGLVAGAVATIFVRADHVDDALRCELGAIMLVGGLMALANPAAADFGAATALMAPVLTSLLGPDMLRRQSWWLLSIVLAVSIVPQMLGFEGTAIAGDMAVFAAGVFVAAAVFVARAASKVGAAYQVFDRSQVNAFRHLVEHVQDTVVRFAPDGEVLFVSSAAESLFGCRRYELSARHLSDRVHLADRPAYLTSFAEVLKSRRQRTIDVRMRQDSVSPDSPHPKFVWVEASLVPVEAGGDGCATELVVLLRDVTDRKDREAAVLEAQKAAQAASDAKSRFLATMGHELRTPLNSVVGFSDMMVHEIGGQLSDVHREYASLINQSGKHLLEVMSMLLDMSRIEAGKFELQVEPIAPESLITPCLSIVEPMAKGRDVAIITQVPDDLPQIVADERACRQVVINLLSNAIKFSHAGGQIVLSAKRQGQNLNISVADTGIGMDSGAIERIGEAFFQVRNGLDREHEGTGLGLSIVKGLVELHGGTLRAVSEVGAGTTMTVLLPLNGPAIKPDDTGSVAVLHREPESIKPSQWQDEKRKAL
ncbi:hypothetical protein GCM10007989_26350 [Devosia pacifica]|uniref:histidine kinase n=2 Tax=Devosia pacifica TaxID=1335967 RepID=A0A918SA31_9HYPH|nr:hypothetical protein GCM10007989_26350 [Devosia pacifica]